MSAGRRVAARAHGENGWMSGSFYKGLGFLVWKGGSWYLRRRYGTASRRIGAGMLGAAVVAGAVVAAQRRASRP